MRWYDYVIVFIVADLLSAAVMVGDILAIALTVFGYLSYEDVRKNK